jgi:hypothetical protein
LEPNEKITSVGVKEWNIYAPRGILSISYAVRVDVSSARRGCLMRLDLCRACFIPLSIDSCQKQWFGLLGRWSCRGYWTRYPATHGIFTPDLSAKQTSRLTRKILCCIWYINCSVSL